MDASTPFCSVIVPTYNRNDALGNCLLGLAKSAMPREHFEVIVVDDGSSQPIDRQVHTETLDLDLRIVRQENAGPATARNAGARVARGELLVFTDDDCIVNPDWLDRLVEAHKYAPGALIGGCIVADPASNIYGSTSQQLITYLYEYHDREQTGRGFFATANLALGREKFWQAGAFDPDFPAAAGEDRDFCDRFQAAGGDMRYEPDARVLHLHDMGLLGYVLQHFNYGQGAYRYHRARMARGQGSMEVEPVKFYFGMLAYPFTQTRNPMAALAGSALMALSQVANVAGYFWLACQSGSESQR
jgi:GT2 family glycosyltransferase